MTQVLHAIEEKIIKALKEYGTSDMTKLLTRTDLGEDQIRRGTEWLRLKKLANVNTQTSIAPSTWKRLSTACTKQHRLQKIHGSAIRSAVEHGQIPIYHEKAGDKTFQMVICQHTGH